MASTNRSILYRVHRWRFVVLAPLAAVVTAIPIFMIYAVTSGDVDGGSSALLVVPLIGLAGYLDFVFAVKLIWPPEIEISLDGIRWLNRAMPGSGRYAWNELDGPSEVRAGHGVSLLQMIVVATGRKLRYPPSHFGVTYDEMAAVIEAAQEGRLLDLQQWRRDHPGHPLLDWLLNWGLALALAAGFIAYEVFRR